MKNSTNRNTVIAKKLSKKVKLIIGGIIAAIIILLGVNYLPGYVEMTKQVQSAKISILNDDLEGALVSYEKAYEAVNKEALLEEIDELKQLIQSKSAFIKGEKFEAEQKYDSAYAYYKQVIPADEERYKLTEPRLNTIAETIVEDIYKQADDLYASHLYAMVIGRLQTALDYNVKLEETEAKILEYKERFFNYYCETAISNIERFYNNEFFYNLFMTDLEHAATYVQTSEQQTKLDELSSTIIGEVNKKYLEFAQTAINNKDTEKARYFLDIVLEFDETNETAKQLLDSLN